MNGRFSKQGLLVSICSVALLLGGCGGGGGASRPAPIQAPPTTVPTPPPAPPPPPPPPPTGGNFDDAEYQRSSAATAHGALSAYNAGGTGRGVTIGIIDSGINPNLAEFAGRIHSASQDLVGSRGVTDTEGHGTAVAGTAAAARNGSGMMGVAFDATILSLNSSSTTDCSKEDGCKHSDSAIAKGVDVAVANGARVINISLGGEGVGSAVLNAVQRATSAGIVVVIAAGNEGKEALGSNPSGFALETARQAGNGLVVIAGAHDANRAITDFSNKAGEGAQYYLTALGSRIRTFDHQGTALLYTGTSFSAPIISGAAALLASAFPNLTGAQIVQLLLTTADDAGAAGRDALYGNGILNIQRAFQPQGKTTAAGSAAPVSLTDNGRASTAMGDAGPGAGTKMTGAIILDGYSRAYALDLAKTLSRASVDRPLAASLGAGDVRTSAMTTGKTSMSIAVDRNLRGSPSVGLAQTGMSYDDSRKVKALAGMVLSRLNPRTAIAFGISESGRALQQRLAGHEQNAFLVARDPMSRSGFHADASSGVGIRQELGPVALTVTSERGKVWNQGLKSTLGEPGYSIGAVTADRKIGPAALSIGASRLQEESTVLGGRFSSAFAGGGATTYFLDSNASFDLGKGWGASASYRRGWTSLTGAGALVENGRLSTEAWAVDLTKRNALARGDKLAFRVMQPLRVSSGGFNLSLPTSYDYATQAVGYEDSFLNLAPQGREIDFEAAYSVSAFGGDLGVNAFYRKEPGHIEAASSDIGGAIRFTLGF